MSEKQKNEDGELADDRELEALTEALAASLRPREIDARRHEEILAQALGLSDSADGERDADATEHRRADALRDLLDPKRSVAQADTGEDSYERRLSGLAHALRLAYAPYEIDQITSERLLRPALKLASAKTARRYVAVTTFTLVAAAAVLMFFVRPTQPDRSGNHVEARAQPLPLIGAHSTMDLFDPAEPFPRAGGTTSRIDKIEASRNAELRDNLFASWGVE